MSKNGSCTVVKVVKERNLILKLEQDFPESKKFALNINEDYFLSIQKLLVKIIVTKYYLLMAVVCVALYRQCGLMK